MKKLLCVFVFAIASISSLHLAHAQQTVRIEVENLQSSDGFWLTPVWVGAHNGTFDFFDAGSAASTSLEMLAEEGDVSGLQSDFGAIGDQSLILGAGFGASTPPLIGPGSTASVDLLISDTMTNRYFSFASMVIPTNDAFIGNDLGTAFQLFDSNGNFNGPLTIELFASDVWDAGTEVNDGMGAPFNIAGGTSTDESLSVRVHPGLDVFDGIETPAGTTINSSGFTGGTAIARFTLTAVPEPNSAAIVGCLSVLGLVGRRRRR